MYTVFSISLFVRQDYLKKVSVALVNDESGRKAERFITHHTQLGKFRRLILSFQAADAATDSTLLD